MTVGTSWRLVVRPERRHEGVGGRLLAARENLARERGCPVVWVATGDDAVEFYQRCGWMLEGGWTNHVLARPL